MKAILKAFVTWCDGTAWLWVLKCKVVVGIAVMVILVLLPLQMFWSKLMLGALASLPSNHLSVWWFISLFNLLVMLALNLATLFLVWQYRTYLGQFVAWCHSTLWPRAKSYGRTAYNWSEPKAKWLWVHKKEKKIWLTAAILATLIMPIFISLWLVHTVKDMVAGNWHPSWLFWIVLCLAVVAAVPAEIASWGLVLQGALKKETVLKAHALIALIVGLPILLIIFWAILKGYISSVIGWYTATVPYPKAVAIIALLILVAVVLKSIFGTKSPASAGSGGGATAHGGGHGNASLLELGIGLLFLVGVVLLALNLLNTVEVKNQENADRRNRQQDTGSIREIPLVVYPGTNYTSFTVGMGTNMVWTANNTSEHIMYHFNNERPEQDREYSPDGPNIILPQMRGSYSAHFRPKGIVPVTLTVYLTPIR